MKGKCAFWASAGASSGAPSRAGGRLLAEPRFARSYSFRSTSILLQSSILVVFYHSIIDTDWVSKCPALNIVLSEALPSLEELYIPSKAETDWVYLFLSEALSSLEELYMPSTSETDWVYLLLSEALSSLEELYMPSKEETD